MVECIACMGIIAASVILKLFINARDLIMNYLASCHMVESIVYRAALVLLKLFINGKYGKCKYDLPGNL